MLRNASTQKALFEAVFDAAAIGVAIGDTEGHLIRCNAAFQTMFGYTEAELRTMTFLDLTHPDDINAHTELFAELMAGKHASFELSKRYVRSDGRVLRAQVTVSLVGDGHTLGVLKDVTAEWEARQERERLVHHLAERVKELMALHEAARLMERADLATHRLLDGIAALLPHAVQHSDVAAGRVTYGASAAATPGYRSTPWTLTAPFTTSDGTKGSVEVAYLEERPGNLESAFFPEERAVLTTLAEMLRTRIDRHLAENEARHIQERLRVALSSVDMGFWEWDIVADRVTWSAEMAELAGQPPEPLVGRFGDHVHLVHPDDAPNVRAGIRRAIAEPTTRTFDVEFRLTPPGGEPRWMFGKGHIFRDETGKAVRLLGVMIDVTRRRLLQEQFLQAQKMEALGQFAGGIAHDFNNVIGVIIGHTDLIANTEMPPDQLRAGLDEISAAAQRAAALTEQLLTFSRSGKTNPQVLDPNEAVTQMESFMRSLAGENELRLSLAPGLGRIRIDPNQLEQAVMNLVVNGRDAMPTVGVITIRTGTTSDGQVTVAVSDTGTGMDDATRARIFEPFFTTKEAGKGTGLGLAVVRSVVEGARGAVVVDSTPGQGTTFELRFPEAK